MDKEQKKDLARIIASAILLLLASFLQKPDEIAFIYYIPAYLLISCNVLLETFKNLIHGELFDEEFLMTVASIGAFIIGEYPEAVAVMLFFGIG